MHVRKLKLRGLYGYIDKDITFDNDITLLVGINGSGKTSILNLINWILKPSIADLCVTEFQVVELEFSIFNQLYRVTCRHNKNTLKYFLKGDRKKFSPLSVRTQTHPSQIKNDEALRITLFQQYSELRPDDREKETWDFISSLPNPSIIGLDRNLYAEESERIYLEESPRSKSYRRLGAKMVSPLERVKEIVNREYRKRKNEILHLTSDLKNHLMLSTFDGGITHHSFTSGIRLKLNDDQIAIVENRVSDYFGKFERALTQSEKSKIKRYFSTLKSITLKHQRNPNDETTKLLYGLNASQFKKVSRLLQKFEQFETESTLATEKINEFLNTLNYFLQDSSKRLLFKEDTSEIVFNILDKNGNVISETKDIKFLSSGEQQILILFSYIAFNSHDGRVFIIDEPELSLHIKWQEDFLEFLEKVTPKETQLILATHSPILVNKKKSKVKVLLPYNQ